MNGLDAVLQRYPWIDAEKLGVTGGSGGFMTNWIVGRRPIQSSVTLRSG